MHRSTQEASQVRHRYKLLSDTRPKSNRLPNCKSLKFSKWKIRASLPSPEPQTSCTRWQDHPSVLNPLSQLLAWGQGPANRCDQSHPEPRAEEFVLQGSLATCPAQIRAQGRREGLKTRAGRHVQPGEGCVALGSSH